MIKIEDGKEYSDCALDYIITTDALTVGDFINEWLTTHPKKWGYFGIKNEKRPLLGEPECEYEYGKIISDPLPKSILSKKIKHVTGCGGYSTSFFQFEIEMDEISEDISNQKLAQIKILKKVRTEIIEKHCDNCTTNKLNVCYKDDLDGYCETYDTLKIIDRNIYKLKGE